MNEILTNYLNKRATLYKNGVEVIKTESKAHAVKLLKILKNLKADVIQKGKFVHIYH